MPTMNVAQFAIKLGLDPSSIPADLQKVVVNLTSAQRRLAKDRKALEAEMMESARESAERTVADRKWADDAILQHARDTASKRKAIEAEILAATRAHDRGAGTGAAQAADRETISTHPQAARRSLVEAQIMESTNLYASEELAKREQVEAEKALAVAKSAEQRKLMEAKIMEATNLYAAEELAKREWVEEEKTLAAQKSAEARMLLENKVMEATTLHAEQTIANEKWAAEARVVIDRKAAAEGAAAQVVETKKGFAGMMLASNAMGAGIPWPLARVLSQQFPIISKITGALLGFTAAGVGIRVVVDIFERLGQKMQEAKQKEQEYQEAIQKTKLVIGEADAASEQRFDKALARSMRAKGDKNAAAFDEGLVSESEAVGATAREVEKLVEAELKEARAKAAQMQAWAAAGKIMHEVFSMQSTLNIEAINGEMQKFGEEFSLRSVEDQANHTSTAMDLLAAETKKAHDAVTDLQNIRDHPAEPEVDFSNAETGYVPEGVTQKEIDALQAKADLMDRITKSEERRKKASDAEKQADIDEANKAKIKDAAAERARQVREEIASLQRLMETSTAAAGAEELLAAATSKGSAAGIQNAAAAEAQKRILDATAESHSKLDSTGRSIGDDKGVQAKLAEYAVVERQNALTEQTAKATSELNKQIGELNTRTDEHVSALNAEAAGHNKVSIEQAKNLERLIPLEQRLQALKDLYASLPAADKMAPTAPGSGTGLGLGVSIARSSAALEGQRGKIGGENAQIQAAAFEEELRKIKDRTAEIAGSGLSPWAKINAEVAAATERMRGLGQSEKEVADQANKLRAAMMTEQGAKIIDSFEKLTETIREAHIETDLLASGSPFAKLAADAEKIGHALGESPKQIQQRLEGMKELQAVQNAGKAWEGADALNAGGPKMYELQQQMATLRSAATTGKVRDDSGIETTLSPEALAAVHLRMQEIAEEEDKILLKTGGIGDGIKAWVDALQVVESEGQFVFNELTQATKGFESTAADSLIKVLESHSNQHQAMIHALRRMWESFFASLTKMAIEHGLQKLLQPLAQQAGNLLPGGKSAAGTVDLGTGAAKQFAAGPGALFSGLVGKAGGGTKDAAQTANTSALTANTTALGANTTALGASASKGIPAPTPGNAIGTNDWAGGSTWVGESGPEVLNLPRGSQVVPNDAVKTSPGGGGDTHITNNDFRGAIVTDDLMRKSDAVKMSQLAEDRAYSRAVTATKEIGLRSRPSR
jgi:hypothetical protein